jgi:hypothetical protein
MPDARQIDMALGVDSAICLSYRHHKGGFAVSTGGQTDDMRQSADTNTRPLPTPYLPPPTPDTQAHSTPHPTHNANEIDAIRTNDHIESKLI